MDEDKILKRNSISRILRGKNRNNVNDIGEAESSGETNGKTDGLTDKADPGSIDGYTQGDCDPSGTDLLCVESLKTTYYTFEGAVPAVDGVSFSIKEGETVGIVGESGCGKSVTALSVMRLVSYPPGKIEAGHIWFEGEDLLTKSPEEMRAIRGDKIAMIFQEPMTSLNPVYTIGDQIAEVLEYHRGCSKAEALERTTSLLTAVGMSDPERRCNQYPHELSGGMRQRAMIAMALSCHPKLLIADEPTTALDVTIQAQILDLMRDLQEEFGMSIMMITHNLGVVAEISEDVVVMYLGRIVESAPVDELFHNPLHPYTQALLKSIPKVGKKAKGRLETIKGVVPDAYNIPPGCSFHQRCPEFKTGLCNRITPDLTETAPGHKVACLLYSEVERHG
ncbi:MAG: ABC transporter ATP-binding protein [Firmicutes bacterium]|nr:ABC transporter ATP-binding protein [Bacillota bacterium]